MKRIALGLALAACALGAAACGDDSGTKQDGGPPIDAPPDATPPGSTLTSYVVDLVKNQTANTTQPRPFSEFSTLPDPDGTANDLTAYMTLFQ